jgi:hypothetical protein
MQKGAAEIGPLQPRTGEIRLVPKGERGPQAGKIGAPEQGLLESGPIGPPLPQAGMAQTGLLKASAPQVAAGKIAIRKVEIGFVAAVQIEQGQGGEAPLARRQGGP